MGSVIRFPELHARASGAGSGRGTPDGHLAPGQLSENHCIVRSSRRTCMSAPASIAGSFLVSRSARQDTVEISNPSESAYARATVISCSMPVMTPISVKLLRKSTAILLRDRSVDSSYPTGMELRDVIAWVDARQSALGLSDRQAEKRANSPSLIQNMRKTLKKGQGSLPKLGSLRALADVLGDPPPDLFEPLAALNGRRSQRVNSSADAVARLRAEQEFYRQKEREFRQKAEALETALAVLQRKAS